MEKSTQIIEGDCLEQLKNLEDNSVDAIVTDPPYGLTNTKPTQVAEVLKAWVTGDTEAIPTTKSGFMNKEWDRFVPPPAIWKECMRVLKPGGHLVVFAGTRTQDLMGLSIRLAGFEIRDTLGWIYGSGFPKNLDISKAIDKAAGVSRKITGSLANGIASGTGKHAGEPGRYGFKKEYNVTAPATDAAKQWYGWGTALKPAIEPIILARKPLDGTVAQNVLEHGVGGLNIDACRVGSKARPKYTSLGEIKSKNGSMLGPNTKRMVTGTVTGRFPANVLLDEHAAKEMDSQSGISTSVQRTGKRSGKNKNILGDFVGQENVIMGHTDSGGASRFFPVFKYQAKAYKKERPVVEREDGTKVQHPTVKPLALMEWLVTLVTPPGGLVLDPFAGTGTTLQAARNKGFDSIGIEADPDYVRLVHARLLEKETKND